MDDVVAEAFARAYAVEDWQQVRHGLSFVMRIARNYLIDEARREAVISFDYMADLETLVGGVSYDNMLTARDELRRLEKIIERLPTQQRRAFLLRRVMGHSIADVAAEMGLSVSTIENHLSRALALITRETTDNEDYGGERPEPDQNAARSYRRGSRTTGHSA